MNIKLLGVTLVGALALAAPSFGGGAPIVAKPLAVGMMKATTIHATTGAMVLDSIVVTSGTLTVFDPAVAKCVPFKVSKGQSFVEPANHVHLARNDTKQPVTLYAMYLGLSNTAKANVGVSAPAGCKA